MITNIHLGVEGRLGNQLFQYAALKSLCLHNNYVCTLPLLSTRDWHGQNCLLESFNLSCNYTEDFSTLEYSYEEPQIDLFDENFYNTPDNTSIRGFFQNVKYFEKHKQEIVEELTPLPVIYNKAESIIARYRQEYPTSEFVAVHIRRGDNVDVNIEFGNRMFGQGTNLAPDSIWGQYLNEAKKVFAGKDVKYLLFTGGSRDNDNTEDLEWVNHNFDNTQHILASTSDVLTDYSLISLCDHNILCHATSFGWWAAYINRNPNKIMVAPKDYFLDGSDASRLITNEFIQI
jgi:hypothetical protein